MEIYRGGREGEGREGGREGERDILFKIKDKGLKCSLMVRSFIQIGPIKKSDYNLLLEWLILSIGLLKPYDIMCKLET